MYVDATTVGVTDKRIAAEIVRAVREALQPFEHHLQRIIVNVQPSGDNHVCRLRVWSERGQTVVVESCATSRHAAVSTATASLKRTLEQAPASRRWSPPVAAAGPVAVERSTTSEHASHVLLALHELDPGAASVHWATVLADALGAELDVCRVLPIMPSTASLPPGRAWLDATRRTLNATRETRVWCDHALPGAVLTERVIAGGADYPLEVAALARQQGAHWIVVPAHEGCGAAAAALARAAGCPVLVARPPTTRCTLLVATEVDTDNYAALESAARLAMALHAPVLAFHDVQGLSTARAATPQVDALAAPWALIQERLQRAADQRPPEIDVLLAYSGDRVQGILQQARRDDAEMIIVSLAADASTAHADQVAARVADRALRSVLIVPVLTAEDADRSSHVEKARTLGWSAHPEDISSAATVRRGRVATERRRWRARRP